jgi:peptidyl-prolyl cis-trans isomerase C
MVRRFSCAALVLASVALALLSAGCAKKNADGGATVARVDGQEIQETDVVKEISRLVALMGPSGMQAQQSPEAMAQLRTSAIQNLVDRALLIARAQSAHLVPSDEDVRAEVARMKAQFPDTATFQARLSQLSMTEVDVQNEIRTSMSIKRLAEQSAASLPAATSEDASKYYRENPEQFESPEEVRASHILIRSPEADAAETRAAARAKAEALLAELRGGRDFADAAKTESGDTGSAVGGGDLGFFQRGRMVPPFEQAAFALKVGELSGIVETPYGYHIIRVTDRREARTLPLEEVQDRIVEFLNNSRGDRAIQSVVEDARSKAKIELLDEAKKG